MGMRSQTTEFGTFMAILQSLSLQCSNIQLQSQQLLGGLSLQGCAQAYKLCNIEQTMSSTWL